MHLDALTCTPTTEQVVAGLQLAHDTDRGDAVREQHLRLPGIPTHLGFPAAT
jgi:hypothetical protein